jgi:RNA polymerase-interacting CarD/CdnL/TRCF family regulator
MDFQVGDPVVHWSFGIGEIVGIEERSLSGQKASFYLVQVRDLTICVPVDSRTESRLRAPTSVREFKKLFTILKGEGEPLIEDRMERKSMLRKRLADGKAETLCKVIRDLSALAFTKPLNEDDRTILHRAQNLLCAEWSYSFSLPLEQAESELTRLLTKRTATPAG